MKRGTRTMAGLALLIVLIAGAPALSGQEDVVARAMRDELARSMDTLGLENLERPYFISYRVQESEQMTLSASFGSLLSRSEGRARWLEVEVRAGDYAFDNTNFVSDRAGRRAAFRRDESVRLPLDDAYDVLRRQIWLATDAAYKAALEDLSHKRAALQNRAGVEAIPDFSREAPVTLREQRPPVRVDRGQAESLVRSLSALFKDMAHVFTSGVSLEAHNVTVRYVNSEGTSFVRDTPWVTFSAVASTQAADGTPLRDFVEFYGDGVAALPAPEQLAASIRRLGANLAALRAAPLVGRYHGAVLFEGQAAAALFGRVFSDRLLALRRPVADDPLTEAVLEENPFLDQLGGRVLPESFDVVDAPGRDTFQGVRLFGGYQVDDEGVPAREVMLVERGILKALLATRTPVRGVARSTGHRTGDGPAPSNLIVTARAGLAAEALRAELLRLVVQRGKEYGLIVRRMRRLTPGGSWDWAAEAQGSGRGEGRVGGVILAVKLFPDGREELIRNVELAGLTAQAFRDILAASQDPAVYSTSIRTPSGDDAIVSLVVPSLLFEDVTVKPVTRRAPKPPLLGHPYFEK